MKAIKLFIYLTLFISISSCNKEEIADGTPACIEQLIKEFNSETDCIVAVDVRKYEFQEENVYLFKPGDCGGDMGSEIYDSECNSIGFLGGADENQIINGEDFSNAVLISVIWSKQP